MHLERPGLRAGLGKAKHRHDSALDQGIVNPVLESQI
jgi:hypothetical protein